MHCILAYCYFGVCPCVCVRVCVCHKWFKEIIYNNKLPTCTELMEILKANETRGYSNYTKSKLIDLLIKY